MERRFELMILTAKSVLVDRCEQRFTTENAPLRATREHGVNGNGYVKRERVNLVQLIVSGHVHRVNNPGVPTERFTSAYFFVSAFL